MFRYFPLPLMSRLGMRSANTKGWIPLLTSTWVAHWNHSPPHIHSFSEASSKISILLIWALFMVDVPIRFAASKRSEKDFYDLENRYMARSFLPLSSWIRAMKKTSSTLWILLPVINSKTSELLKRLIFERPVSPSRPAQLLTK